MNASFSPRQSNHLYRAFLRKDRRLEGRAFIAVRTTGIYCLLTCRARTPRRENVSFFATRSAAEHAGYRPCRKCRPEVNGGRNALERMALRRLLARLSEEDSAVRGVAVESGASPSKIYRMFRRNLGRSPRQARGEARVRRACDLLRDTQRSVTDVAFEAGFASVASFYRWFRRSTGKTPTEFRKS